MTAGLLAVCAAVSIMLGGCATAMKSPYIGTAWNIGVPAAKDIQILGVVHYEALVKNGNGERITWDALLKEAEKQGGNGIVNVMIDVKREGTKFLFFYLNPKETWYGSALAIKYLNENLSVNETTDNGTKMSTPASGSQSEIQVAPAAGLFNFLKK
jgi:hypothetical protein